jgi:hypothetical protein
MDGRSSGRPQTALGPPLGDFPYALKILSIEGQSVGYCTRPIVTRLTPTRLIGLILRDMTSIMTSIMQGLTPPFIHDRRHYSVEPQLYTFNFLSDTSVH